MYQIVDLRKALIEIDNLVLGLRNRMVLAVQRVVKIQDRESVRDLPHMVAAVKAELAPVEIQWGIKVHEFGFLHLLAHAGDAGDHPAAQAGRGEAVALPAVPRAERAGRDGGGGAHQRLGGGSAAGVPEVADRAEVAPRGDPPGQRLLDFDGTGDPP